MRERNREKNIYDEQVLFFYSSVYLSIKDHLLLVGLVIKRQSIIQN